MFTKLHAHTLQLIMSPAPSGSSSMVTDVKSEGKTLHNGAGGGGEGGGPAGGNMDGVRDL